MVFYVLPPEEVRLLDMIDGGYNRLKFLLGLHEEKRGNHVSVNVNYLIENSELDIISHFALRLLCLYSKEFSQFFVIAETQFFEYRMEGIDGSTAFEALQSFKRELKLAIDDHRSEELKEFHVCAIGICDYMEEEILSSHIFHSTHHRNCRKYILKVPFSYCAELIKKREVDLRDGFCLVHCGIWKALLRCIFNFRLYYLVKHIKRFINIRNLEIDGRIHLIVQPLLDLFKHNVKTNTNLEVRGSLLSSQVDQESELFPPCARNALIHLRENHRLRHQTRFQFTLFLKDIGMDVNEAMIFWKNEYSQKFEGSSKVVERDLWNQKKNHYMYNIRHTYGMEGACKQYSSFSCSHIQVRYIAVRTKNKTVEGGCPFQTMSKTELVKFLHTTYFVPNSPERTEIPPIEDILSYVSLGKPSEACMTCFNACKRKMLNIKEVTKSNFQENVTDAKVVSHKAFCGSKNIRIDLTHKGSAESTRSCDSNESLEKESDIRYGDLDFELNNPIQFYLALKKLQ